ncbi:MAG TPA: family 20 glycosylhydrolase, partial [Phycisphaerae bacterium]|nr:family 20 glycosylhydrolase [Phycisphaerae bacterium]
MIGFHIDFNVHHFKRDYLERWLTDLAGLGYDTILWELEDAVAWDTCPRCAPPDAYTKDEFRELLALSRRLGLEPVPLLQTIGHCEYVLRHRPYSHLAETPDRVDQYCPRNSQLVPFLRDWIDEYLDLFGDVRHFHIGADEAWQLGACPDCKAYAERHSLSQLYIDHVNAVCTGLIERGVRPCIWADMILHHHEAIDRLSRKIVLFDWMYDIYRGNGKVCVWGKGLQRKEDLSPETLATFGESLFPEGDEPGREPETFYTADCLVARGFDVVTCPSSASGADSVFAPRHWLHMINTYDSVRKGHANHLYGSALTSWTIRIHPWELQRAIIELAPHAARHPHGPITAFEQAYTRRHFGADRPEFWRACGLLAKPGLFNDVRTLGFGKNAVPVPEDHVQRSLTRLAADGRIDHELAAGHDRLAEYRLGLDLFRALSEPSDNGSPILKTWLLAARNLINRAETTAFLLTHAATPSPARPLVPAARQQGADLLEQLRELRSETGALYGGILKPIRRELVIDWLYRSIE